jgi:diguanylate cyclase (GGDEF)-like protein
MVRHDLVTGDRPGRAPSLRRDWSLAFRIMLVVLLAASVATLVGVLVRDFSDTARRLDRESVTAATLRGNVVDHEATAHQLLSGAAVDRQAFLSQQAGIFVAFHDALGTFPAGKDADALGQAARSWQAALTKAGLWGDQLDALQGPHDELQAELSANSDEVRALLDGLQSSALQATRSRLAHDAGLERRVLAVLATLLGVALAVTAYFRRRMANDLVLPIASMWESVLRIQGGDYDHRLKVARHDELGELAEAFNGMARALTGSHMALVRGATHDEVTGLANRSSLMERLAPSFGPGTHRGPKENVLSIDIDNFKDINFSVGHDGADVLLAQMGVRLKGCARPHDLVTCLGGDEFAIAILEDDAGSPAVVIAERILKVLRAPFVVRGTRLIVTVSIGVAQQRPETHDAAELLRDGDFAMEMAKRGGKNRYELFDVQLHDEMVRRSALKADLAVAVGSGQLRLEYQPVADLRTGEVVGLEALVRWQHPTLGPLAPGAFIGLAEETGDIDAIGCWVLDAAARQVAGWRRSMHHCEELWVSVNISAVQLPRPGALAAIQAILGDPAVQADKVVLEIGETALAAEGDGGAASLGSLKRFGVRIAIDDFGTGVSSLSTLARLPVDILKIDRCFISGQASTTPSVPMLEGIIGLASKLSLVVIAEGIEEPEQLDLVRTMGCQMGQGYLLARPAPPHQLEALLASGGLLYVTESNATTYRLAALKSAQAADPGSPKN